MNSGIPHTTRETALELARAVVVFPFLEIRDTQQSLDVVRCERSHETIFSAIAFKAPR